MQCFRPMRPVALHAGGTSGSRNRISNGLGLAPVVGDPSGTTSLKADIPERGLRQRGEGHVRATKAQRATLDGVVARSFVRHERSAMIGTQAQLESRHAIAGRR